ncbi:hypothetical protein FN846DRAFT_913216 [Sphaerosporella brunnea]|uniref:Uncharacterized protein n=1 Tax=Sphaerosporella brunnea TaxID=1250544 RepID=A0A5J5EGF6_9PEZI|nr:hypothetical protein FN846DRAFT_913216 [Sphaerosporella brunnea]
MIEIPFIESNFEWDGNYFDAERNGTGELFSTHRGAPEGYNNGINFIPTDIHECRASFGLSQTWHGNYNGKPASLLLGNIRFMAPAHTRFIYGKVTIETRSQFNRPLHIHSYSPVDAIGDESSANATNSRTWNVSPKAAGFTAMSLSSTTSLERTKTARWRLTAAPDKVLKNMVSAMRWEMHENTIAKTGLPPNIPIALLVFRGDALTALKCIVTMSGKLSFSLRVNPRNWAGVKLGPLEQDLDVREPQGSEEQKRAFPQVDACHLENVKLSTLYTLPDGY